MARRNKKTAEDTGQRRRRIVSGGGALPHPLRSGWLRDYLNPRSGVAFDRRGLVFEDLEDGDQFGDRQQIADALGRVQELQIAAGPLNGRVAADDLAQTAAVHIWHAGQIQQQFCLAAFDQLIDFALQLDVALAEKNLAFNVENSYVAALALCNSHTRPPIRFGFFTEKIDAENQPES